MERFLCVCLAGALGSGIRYLVGLWSVEKFGASFPYGTLIVNVTGCFLLAAVMHLALHVASFPATLRVAITSGFMGGLTTYSSFNYETTAMVRSGAYGFGVLNLVVTIVACLLAGLLGLAVAGWLVKA